MYWHPNIFDMIVIGDVHGKVDEYLRIIQRSRASIQVGDFGFKSAHEWHLNTVDPDKHKVIFGNHDYYPMLDAPHSLGNYAMLDGGVMTIRGAWTRDKVGTEWVLEKDMHGNHIIDEETGQKLKKLVSFRRVEGMDIFEHQDELSVSEGNEVLDKFIEHKPSIVISHECPMDAAIEMMAGLDRSPDKTRTTQLLQGCFEQHQPDLWIFGHYHWAHEFKINGTRFVCLDELQVMEL